MCAGVVAGTRFITPK